MRPVPTSLPCPRWCDKRDAHPFTDLEDGQLLRVHEHALGPAPTHAAVECWERALSAAGPSDYGQDVEALLVRVELGARFGGGSGGFTYLTPAGARRLAGQLIEAAAMAESEVATWS